jgi:hypothetical protein
MGRVLRIADYQSAPDASAASWIIARLRGFAESVVSFVPAGFEAYGRVFHPAWRHEPDTPVLWREVAQANGRLAHRGMQWPSITGEHLDGYRHPQPGIWDREPDEGSLPRELAPALVSVLSRHTGNPERCWFAVWEGWGCLAFDRAAVPAFEIPNRRLLLFVGPITAVGTSLCESYFQSPSIWWPDDRAWCVETEVDAMSTYVGGTSECIAELGARNDLEAMTVEPSDGVMWASDQLNPPPT